MRATQRFLVIGDQDHSMEGLIAHAMPGAQVQAVPTYFDALAELGTGSGASYTAVLASVEPIERRPEAAVRTLRELTGPARLILFGQPTLEPLQRKMLEFGCDDYVVTPAAPAEIAQALAAPGPRVAREDGHAPAAPVMTESPLVGVALADIVLDALVHHPHNAAAEVIRALNEQLTPHVFIDYVPPGGIAPEAKDGTTLLSCHLRIDDDSAGMLYLTQNAADDQAAGVALLAELAPRLDKVVAVQNERNKLKGMAITDDLTGLFNGRYFRTFLAQIIETAKARRFPVTLLLFDIDDFKKYNDRYGHGAGDEILKQTGELMKRCCRDHDFVSRISGDEFAVIFWEKDPPRQPKDPGQPPAGRTPSGPMAVFERFKKSLMNHEYKCLGPSGKGSLTVSGGLAVYPYDAMDANSLIEAADNALMFGAKKSGKNSCHLVWPEQTQK